MLDIRRLKGKNPSKSSRNTWSSWK